MYQPTSDIDIPEYDAKAAKDSSETKQVGMEEINKPSDTSACDAIPEREQRMVCDLMHCKLFSGGKSQKSFVFIGRAIKAVPTPPTCLV